MKYILTIFIFCGLIFLLTYNILFDSTIEKNSRQQLIVENSLVPISPNINSHPAEIEMEDQLNHEQKNSPSEHIKVCATLEEKWLDIFVGESRIANWLSDHGYSADDFPTYGIPAKSNISYSDYNESTLSKMNESGDRYASKLLAKREHSKAFQDLTNRYNLRYMKETIVDNAIEKYRSSIVKGNFSDISRISSLYREKYLYGRYVNHEDKQWKSIVENNYDGNQSLIISLAWLKFGALMNDPIIMRQLEKNSLSFKNLNQIEILEASNTAKQFYQQIQFKRTQLGYDSLEYQRAPFLDPKEKNCFSK